ncbi:alpha-galactosidase [Lederbergia graminis]|uniref:Alpha-galactosidase n=1 Tax=Lederbergia graminis TaxID=735518 RepID=A0ABW0LNY6_9BACI
MRHVFAYGDLQYEIETESGLKLKNIRHSKELPWNDPYRISNEFAIHIDGEVIDGSTEGMVVQDVLKTKIEPDAEQVTIVLEHIEKNLRLEVHTIFYENTSLIERWMTVQNNSDNVATITRMDSLSLVVPAAKYELMYFTSDWGVEFEPVRKDLEESTVLETKSGRSSKGMHPWFTLLREDGQLLTATVMWSGNWAFRFERMDSGSFAISGGLHDWEFSKQLKLNETIESVRVVLALGENNDINTTSVQFAQVGRKHWYPNNEFSNQLPIEWNHWWSYSDKFVDETSFKHNVDVAASLGIDVCTLDAGWFGPAENEADWYDYRGDWDLVNVKRFPSGIRHLSDYVHEKGLKFGLWCEIEGLGKKANLAKTNPEFVATRDNESLGYVCFGNPDAQEWAFSTLDSLITDYNCDWIKLDFNLDPGAGCNRSDHGHDCGDGLYEHYIGYYHVLRKIRDKHPQVILESCSSGGLRIDVGMLKETHTTFLSDPDWPEHDLQIFWGATTMLAPNVCLHWGYSEWFEEPRHEKQNFNPRDPNLQEHQLDYYSRISMLGGFGFSQRFPELPEWVEKRFAEHTAFYNRHVKKFVQGADLYRLTEQPLREGKGERWPAFQYSLPTEDEHLLFVFRMDNSSNERIIKLTNLERDKQYTVTWLTENRDQEFILGSVLMDTGILFEGLEEESAVVLKIK